MRYHQFKQKQRLLEGGNIFKAPDWTTGNKTMLTDRINRDEVEPTVNFLQKLTGIDFSDSLLGSTGIAASSGDIDIAIPATVNKDEFIQRLLKQGVSQSSIAKTGISVHYMSPIIQPNGKKTDRFVQVDFMFVPDVEFVKWSMKSAPSDTYKGKHVQQLRGDLVNAVSPKYPEGHPKAGTSTLKWNQLVGVQDRDTNKIIFGRTSDATSSDPDMIAKGLMGKNATRHDLESVESILNAIRNNQYRQQIINTYRKTLARDREGPQLPPEEELTTQGNKK